MKKLSRFASLLSFFMLCLVNHLSSKTLKLTLSFTVVKSKIIPYNSIS